MAISAHSVQKWVRTAIVGVPTTMLVSIAETPTTTSLTRCGLPWNLRSRDSGLLRWSFGREHSVGRRGGLGRRGYPGEFRRRVVDLLAAGRKVADVARDLGVSEQAVYGWRRQERTELAAAKRRIRELEAELAVHRRAAELLKETSDPQGGSGRSG
jgi:transposase